MSAPRARKRPIHDLIPADYKLFLQALREDRCVEYPIVGTDAIGAWFHRMRFAYLVPSVDTLHRWRRQYGCPITQTARNSRVRKREAWTTNLMLQAWLGTQGRALTLPRWHPFRRRVEDYYSKNPNTVRWRKLVERKRRAAYLTKVAVAEALVAKPRPQPVRSPAPDPPVHAKSAAVPARYPLRRLAPAIEETVPRPPMDGNAKPHHVFPRLQASNLHQRPPKK